MSYVPFKIKQDKTELLKQKVTVTSVAVATTKFLLGMCDCTTDSDAGTGHFSLALAILHMCGHAYVRSHVSPGMDWRIFLMQNTPKLLFPNR